MAGGNGTAAPSMTTRRGLCRVPSLGGRKHYSSPGSSDARRDAAEGVEDRQAKKAIEGRARCWPKVSALIITKQAKAIFRFPIGIFFVPARLSIGMSRER